MKKDPRISTAYHEAGHAGLSVLTGRKFIYVTIKQNGYSEGYVKSRRAGYTYKDTAKNIQKLLKEGIFISAGYLSELMITGITIIELPSLSIPFFSLIKSLSFF